MAIHLPALALTALLLLATAACSTDEPGAVATSAPAAPAEDAPVPVEGDGGIGGEGGGPATSSLILSADQVEVTGACLLRDDPPTYRLDLADGGVLTADTGTPGTVTLALDGTTFTSPEDQPPAVSPGSGAVSVQGRVVSGDGDEHFVDAVIGLDGLPDC